MGGPGAPFRVFVGGYPPRTGSPRPENQPYVTLRALSRYIGGTAVARGAIPGPGGGGRGWEGAGCDGGGRYGGGWGVGVRSLREGDLGDSEKFEGGGGVKSSSDKIEGGGGLVTPDLPYQIG